LHNKQSNGLSGASYSVAEHRKKIGAVGVAVILGIAVLVVCTVQSAAVEPKKALFNNSDSVFAKDANSSIMPTEESGTRELFYKMMFSVLLVVVLGAAAIYISKKYGARITKLPGKKIRIIETVHLGPRRAVHLLEAGNKQLLIGSTTESITRLADVTDALYETDLSTTKNE
jgi:flagellar biosynthetic protein FliO